VAPSLVIPPLVPGTDEPDPVKDAGLELEDGAGLAPPELAELTGLEPLVLIPLSVPGL